MNNEEFKVALEKYPLKKKYVKIILLSFNEEDVIGEIQGRVTGGNISIDGSSAMRRTVNLTMLLEEKDLDLQNIDNLISINKKFILEIGEENNVDKDRESIVWYRQGIFLISQSSSSFQLSNISISISAKDKMCLLNGEVGGVLPATVAFHEQYNYTYGEDGEVAELEIVNPTIYQIIQETVNHFGKESLNKIIINDVPLQARQLMEYKGKNPIYFETTGGVFTGNYSFKKIYPEYQEYNYGDCIGYEAIDFIYPGELILSAGDTVCTLLDSIVTVLGNYEYFYDINGNFVFQEKKNYMVNPYISSIIETKEESYYSDYAEPKEVYNFNEANMQTAFTLNPNYENIKNDFIVWGTRKTPSGAEVDIRYHLAIDDKPTLSQGIEDWREELYQQGKDSEKNNIESNYYWEELAAEWRKLYDPNNSEYRDTDNWNPDVIYNPESLDYFLDFISTGSEVGKFSINSIGRRTKVINDSKINSIYHREVPDIIFIRTAEEEQQCQLKGQAYSYVSDYLDSIITISTQRKSAFEVIRESLYQYTFYNDTISMTAVPVYDLEPNTRVRVDYSPANIHGSYIIKSINFPLNYNGLMSITLNKALEII